MSVAALLIDYASVTGPCGHTVAFEAACMARDEFVCPVCKHCWHVREERPHLMPSGFIMPGKRTVCAGLKAVGV